MSEKYGCKCEEDDPYHAGCIDDCHENIRKEGEKVGEKEHRHIPIECVQCDWLYKAGEKKGRQKELLKCFEHKEEHNRQVKYLVDQARQEAFDEAIEMVAYEDTVECEEHSEFACISCLVISCLVKKLKEKRI